MSYPANLSPWVHDRRIQRIHANDGTASRVTLCGRRVSSTETPDRLLLYGERRPGVPWACKSCIATIKRARA